MKRLLFIYIFLSIVIPCKCQQEQISEYEARKIFEHFWIGKRKWESYFYVSDKDRISRITNDSILKDIYYKVIFSYDISEKGVNFSYFDSFEDVLVKRNNIFSVYLIYDSTLIGRATLYKREGDLDWQYSFNAIQLKDPIPIVYNKVMLENPDEIFNTPFPGMWFKKDRKLYICSYITGGIIPVNDYLHFGDRVNQVREIAKGPIFRGHNSVEIFNLSSKTIYVAGSFCCSDTLMDFDSAFIEFDRSKLEPRAAKPSIYSEVFFEEILVDDNKLIVFVFDADVIENYSWETIVENYMILKRYELSLEDLKNRHWIIEYP